jgi:spore maturation protein CgeB
VPVYQAGGRAKRISLERYAEILGRSKISLNFSYSLPGTHALHGRVFEVMFSGALLIENLNTETPQYFTPMSDYVAFDTKEDLVDKVRYYLEHEDERQQIALNGYRKATKEYSPQVFWDRVMAKLAELNLLAT